MTQETNPDEYLVQHYLAIDELKSDFRNRNLFNLVAGLVTGNEVVDIGCGVGSFANQLKEKGKNVLGIEPSEGMRNLAAEINPKVNIVSGMAEDVGKLVKNQVDTITMLDVLEHVENDTLQVKRIYSVLNEKGEFVFVVPAHPLLYGQRDKNMGHYRRYTKKMLKNILIHNNFRIKYMRHWNALGFFPYFVSEKIFNKPLESRLRKSDVDGAFSRFARNAFHLWFSRIENNFDFGFGLSIICVAQKI
jgi:2-polyprenyl-3-methyl-5-hydroxy-6-metoxy-1,4-benzoquinol methylase